MDTAELTAWLTTAGFVVILVVLMVMGWRMFQRRRREEMREELADELQKCVERLGLGTVWQTPLFQADVYGIRGGIDGYDVRAELWDKSSRDFFRLTVHFPHATAQTFRLMTRRRRGLEHLWRMHRISVDDDLFEESFSLYGRREDQKRLAKLFDASLRRELLALANQVKGLKLGTHSLYVHVDKMVDPPVVEEVIEQALEICRRLFDQSVEIGSVEEELKAEYATASMDMVSRDGESTVAEQFPEGGDEHLTTGEHQVMGEESSVPGLEESFASDGDGASGEEPVSDSEEASASEESSPSSSSSSGSSR